MSFQILDFEAEAHYSMESASDKANVDLVMKKCRDVALLVLPPTRHGYLGSVYLCVVLCLKVVVNSGFLPSNVLSV